MKKKDETLSGRNSVKDMILQFSTNNQDDDAKEEAVPRDSSNSNSVKDRIFQFNKNIKLRNETGDTGVWTTPAKNMSDRGTSEVKPRGSLGDGFMAVVNGG